MIYGRIMEGHRAKQEEMLQGKVGNAGIQVLLKERVLDPNARIGDKVSAIKRINDHWFVRDRVRWAVDQAVRLAAIARMGESSFRPQQNDIDYLVGVSRIHADPVTMEAAGAQVARIKRMLAVEEELRSSGMSAKRPG